MNQHGHLGVLDVDAYVAMTALCDMKNPLPSRLVSSHLFSTIIASFTFFFHPCLRVRLIVTDMLHYQIRRIPAVLGIRYSIWLTMVCCFVRCVISGMLVEPLLCSSINRFFLPVDRRYPQHTQCPC